VKAYGALGIALIVLSFLELVSLNIMLLGFALVALDSYTSHNYYKDIEDTKNALLTIVSLLWYDLNNEDEQTIDEE
jgi:hypothetical protein